MAAILSLISGNVFLITFDSVSVLVIPKNQPMLENELLPPAENFESPDLSIPGVMQWLTGQRHKPIGSGKFEIAVSFDHDCMQRNPQHRVCFPRVGACGKEITFPRTHTQTDTGFHKLF